MQAKGEAIMGVHAPRPRQELKDRHFTKVCSACGAENHVLVTYDPQRNHSHEAGVCWRCGAVVHEEDCFLIWTGSSQRIVEGYSAQAARLRRAL
jgi:hypothetical protein